MVIDNSNVGINMIDCFLTWIRSLGQPRCTDTLIGTALTGRCLTSIFTLSTRAIFKKNGEKVREKERERERKVMATEFKV